MINIKNILIEQYNYNLPDDKIAKYPLQQRDQSKLLVYKNKTISEKKFYNISNEINSDELLVFNNTKVIHARLYFKKETGAKIELFCLEPFSPNDYALNFASTSSCKWVCIVGNLKKWKKGNLIKKFFYKEKQCELEAKLIKKIAGKAIIEFSWNHGFSFVEIIDYLGEIPIPPYLNRNSEELDNETYQTIYSKFEGSVAAPTAGLHFTEEVFSTINAKIAEVTLHVGAGTFQPVKSNKIIDHSMHIEHFIINKTELQEIIEFAGKITAVGTTSVRTLESLYLIGCNIINKVDEPMHVTQWQAYDEKYEINSNDALEAILNYMKVQNLEKLYASTEIMIVPGYEFRLIHKLITNFHQPKSTLLLLIAAIVGDNWKEIYDYALKHHFRFLSYGDSSILYL